MPWGVVLTALLTTLVADLIARHATRKALQRRRAHGGALSSVVVVGAPASILPLAASLGRDVNAGMHVVGACVPARLTADPTVRAALSELDAPLLGGIDAIRQAVLDVAADVVAVAACDEITPEQLRWISWQLEGTTAELVVAPGLVEVAAARMHVQPVDGQALVHVEEPRFTGFRPLLKGLVDRTVAAAALVLLAPVLLAIAAAIRFTDGGPALFCQTRVGKDGRAFTMLKFRSMCVDAEQRKGAVEHLDDGNGVLFKVRRDPRVTRVGRIVRKLSLDELPQLINVLTGSMSLVGPRPQLPGEVAGYTGHVHRRLLVKPGLTGLWQVSGRSDLSWDESVRLDLRYVENWSPALDLSILWRTVGAVLKGNGAY
jgi:exopolysaccharide biosynthesis polyprenyl glycosylphosphotransferase